MPASGRKAQWRHIRGQVARAASQHEFTLQQCGQVRNRGTSLTCRCLLRPAALHISAALHEYGRSGPQPLSELLTIGHSPPGCVAWRPLIVTQPANRVHLQWSLYEGSVAHLVFKVAYSVAHAA